MIAPNFSFAQSKHVISSVAALLTFATLGLNEAHADGMRFSAAPPFIWTDETPSVAQQLADLISDTFGTVHKLGPGTFIGAALPPVAALHVPSGKGKSAANGNAFGSARAIHINGSNSNSGTSERDAGGVSSLIHQLVSSGQISGSGGASTVLGAALNSNNSTNVADANASVQVIANPLPGALPLFITGMVGLGLLGWRKKRKA